MVRQGRFKPASMAASSLRCKAMALVERLTKLTLPLARIVLTFSKPASSSAALSAGIFAFIGLMPRKNAAYAAFAMAPKLHVLSLQ